MNKLRPNIEECEKLLRALVRTDTSQPAGNEGMLADWILKELQGKDSSGILEYSFLEHGGKRESLVVKIKGRREGKGTAFAGHLDTVACEADKDWIYAPLNAAVENGILYGRGAADMKGGVAAMMLTAEYLLSRGERPEEPVFFFFTADEEKDGIGARTLVEKGYMDQVGKLFICEPSNREVGFCEKGALWIRTEIHGASAHASRPEIGRNAIEYAMKFEREFRKKITAGEPHRELGKSTMSITRLEGGIMTNIIPDKAVMEMDIRTVPGILHKELIRCAEEIAQNMEEQCEELKCCVSVMNDRPAVETDPEDSFVKAVRRAAEMAGMEGKLRGLYFYTDASQIIPGTGIPFVILGPGDDKMAHCVNEKISLAEIAEMTETYLRFLQDEVL